MTGIFRAAMLGAACLASLAAGTGRAAAADYPNRPVRWLIGFTAGGPVDTVARIMAQWLSERFGQQFVVENRAGSGGNLAAAAAINSPPDGYTLLFVAPNNAISTSLYKKLPYDFIRDTVPVASIMQLTNMMVVPTSLPVKTVQEFIDYCKANPGKVSYASSGNGTSVHMSAELFKALTKVEMTHVPYRGSSAAMPDLISNKVQVLFDNLPSSLPHIHAGKLRALAVASEKRVASLPDVPTFAETGQPLVNDPSWFGLIGPAKLPDDIVKRLHSALVATLKQPEAQKHLQAAESIAVGNSPDAFRKVVAVALENTRKVVREAKLKFD